MVIGLIGWLYVARYLGPDGYGLLNYGLSFVGLFATVAALGIDQLLVRELVRDPSSRAQLMGTATGLRLVGSLIAIGLIFVLAIWVEDGPRERQIIWLISITLLFQALGCIESYFAAEVRSRYIVYVQLFQSIISLALRILFIELQMPLVWFAILLVLDSALLYIGMLYAYKRFAGSMLVWTLNFTVAKRLLVASWPIIFTGIFITIYLKIDQVMLKLMVGEYETGIYAAAVKLSETWYFIPAIITASVFPAILNARDIGSDLYFNRLQKLYDIMTLMSVSLALLISFIATPLVTLIFGQSFSPAGPVLALHIWAGVLVFGSYARQRWILAENLQAKEVWLNLSGAAMNVLFNLILIPRYGSLGAALATILSYFIGLYLMTYLIRDFRPFFRMYNASFVHLLTLRALRTRIQ